MMDTVDIERLCASVENAVEQVSIGVQSKIDSPKLLDRFWCLQDQVTRLVESASDSRQETFEVLKKMHPALIQNIRDALNFARKLHFDSASALSGAAAAINRSLTKLEQLREQDNVVAAKA